MSDILEHTLSTLPNVLVQNLLGTTAATVNKHHQASKTYHFFVRYIVESPSKTEARQYAKRELSQIEKSLSQPNLSHADIKDCMLRAVYCGILGYDVSFVNIHAVKLAQSGSLNLKKIGYMACSILLDERHELALLLINTIIKDLQSSNVVCVNMALTVAGQLVSADMISTVLPSVIKSLKHSSEVIRKKGVACMYHFLTQAPDALQGCEPYFRAALSDRDAGVMAAVLPAYHYFIKKNPGQYTHLIPGFLSTLTQVIRHHIPADYTYHSVPAPWTQISLLRILTLLTQHHTQAASQMYPVLKEVLQRASSNENIAFAILYECVVSLASVCSQPQLLETAYACVANFLKSTNNNFRYVGLEALEMLVGVAPRLASQQQVEVLRCLADPDPSIQRKTYAILCNLTNASNMTVVCDKLTEYVTTSTDRYLRREVITKLAGLIGRFSPDDTWRIQKLLKLIELSGDDIPESSLNFLFYSTMRERSPAVVQTLVNSCIDYLSRDALSNSLLQAAVWTFGEYSPKCSVADKTLESVMHHYKSTNTNSTSQCHIISALLKLRLHDTISGDVVALISSELMCHSQGRDITQRISEFGRLSELLISNDTLVQTLTNTPMDDDVDLTLCALDEYVCGSIEAGEPVYRPPHLRHALPTHTLTPPDSHDSGLTASDMPFINTMTAASETSHASRHSEHHSSNTSGDFGPCVLKMDNVKRVWDKSGYRSLDDDTKGDKLNDEELQKKNDLAKAIFGES